MKEYLHNACHIFFATTTTTQYQNSTQGQQQNTSMEVHTQEGREHSDVRYEGNFKS